MSDRTPYFLGAGLSTCLGSDVESCVNALRQPAQAPVAIECEVFDDIETIPYKLLKDVELKELDQRIYTIIDTVVQQAISEARLTHKQQQNTALFVGSSSFDISVSEYLYQKELKEADTQLPLRLSSFGNVATYIRHQFLLKGPDYSFNTACTASANALLAAGEMIRVGRIEHALVVGVELYNDITALGFHGLDLLTRSVMRPFDKDRDGLVLGEACSAVVLGSDRSHMVQSRPFYLCGGANRCDTYSISAANPDGSTIADVMVQAIKDASLTVDKIKAIKVHGTASLSNDESEAQGMLSVFDTMPGVCALKPFIGHTLGACGLTELILFYRAIDADFLPATPGIGEKDNGLGIKLNQYFDSPGYGHFLLNYFGFGGNNSSVVISNY